jgi:hypothetical protein
LRQGDVVLELDGQPVESTIDLITQIEAMDPQGRVELLVERNNQQVTIPAVLGNRENYATFDRGFQQRWDNQRWNTSSQGFDDEFSNVPQHAMQLEHDRRMAEQHERIESELRKLQEEVRMLRSAIQGKEGSSQESKDDSEEQ